MEGIAEAPSRHFVFVDETKELPIIQWKVAPKSETILCYERGGPTHDFSLTCVNSAVVVEDRSIGCAIEGESRLNRFKRKLEVF